MVARRIVTISLAACSKKTYLINLILGNNLQIHQFFSVAKTYSIIQRLRLKFFVVNTYHINEKV